VDAAHLDLGLLYHLLGSCHAAVCQPTLYSDQSPPDALLDDLHIVQVLPDDQARASRLARVQRIAKHLQDTPDVRFEAIDGHQNRLPWYSSRPSVLDHWCNQRLVAVPANRAPQPEAREDTHRRRDPDRAGLGLGIQFVSLHLAQIDVSLADQ